MTEREVSDLLHARHIQAPAVDWAGDAVRAGKRRVLRRRLAAGSLTPAVIVVGLLAFNGHSSNSRTNQLNPPRPHALHCPFTTSASGTPIIPTGRHLSRTPALAFQDTLDHSHDSAPGAGPSATTPASATIQAHEGSPPPVTVSEIPLPSTGWDPGTTQTDGTVIYSHIRQDGQTDYHLRITKYQGGWFQSEISVCG